MSVELVNPPTGAATLPAVPGPITDLVILFGGWGNVDNAEPIAAGPGSGASELYRSVRDLPTPPGGHPRKFLALSGSAASSAGVDQGVDFIRHDFHPFGKLIIYGYSAGGTDAMSLCRRINRDLSYYGFTSHRLVNVFRMEDAMGREVFGKVRVDLLITVDAAVGPLSGAVNRSVPYCVIQNLNFYQSIQSRIGSRGGPNVPASTRGTSVDNFEITGTTHGAIDEATNPRVLEAIRGALGYEAPPPLLPRGTMLA